MINRETLRLVKDPESFSRFTLLKQAKTNRIYTGELKHRTILKIYDQVPHFQIIILIPSDMLVYRHLLSPR